MLSIVGNDSIDPIAIAPGDEWGVRSVRFRITLRCGDQAEIKEESYDFGFGCYIDSCDLDVVIFWDGSVGMLGNVKTLKNGT